MPTCHLTRISQPLIFPTVSISSSCHPLLSISITHVKHFVHRPASSSHHFSMASAAAALTMAMPSPCIITRKETFFGSNAFHATRSSPKTTVAIRRSHCGLTVRASSSSSAAKEQVVAGLTAAALAVAMVIPEVAEAAQPGISPSLKNFLLSIVAGGVVLVVLVGAVIAVANFDPVKRT